MDAWLLAPDNFTPASRTPWGGRAIVAKYKRGLGLDESAVVGESWEVSAGPEFPSRVEGENVTLAELFARDPERILGDEAPRGSTSLLVKLLDAADNLSVQIHPSDGYVGLASDECGKPESWYVLDAREGAGLYLGLAERTTRESMRDALSSGGDVSSLLGFVPVAPGDFFVVEAGTAHAIGRGVTLIEPQVVRPGRKGVTYRYWDWNRLYDARGVESPDGAPRALHVEHALAVTDWERVRGEGFLKSIRVRAGAPDVSAPLRVTRLCGRSGAAVASNDLEVARVDGRGSLELFGGSRLRAITVVDGSVDVVTGATTLTVREGRSAVISASARATLRTGGAHALVSSVA